MPHNKLTSIIFTSYDQTQVGRNITRCALERIFKYTDDGDYEIIWIDTVPVGAEALWWNKHYEKLFEFNKRDDRKWITHYCKDEVDPGQYARYNEGAKLAKGDYLCFFQNDVFVNEGWLTDLRYYLDNQLADAIVPDQGVRTRQEVKDSYGKSYEESTIGNRDAGLILMTREVYNKVGGWDESMRIHYGEKMMYLKLGTLGSFTITTKTMITHLEHANGWDKRLFEKGKYDEDERLSGEHLRIYEGR